MKLYTQSEVKQVIFWRQYSEITGEIIWNYRELSMNEAKTFFCVEELNLIVALLQNSKLWKNLISDTYVQST